MLKLYGSVWLSCWLLECPPDLLPQTRTSTSSPVRSPETSQPDPWGSKTARQRPEAVISVSFPCEVDGSSRQRTKAHNISTICEINKSHFVYKKVLHLQVHIMKNGNKEHLYFCWGLLSLTVTPQLSDSAGQIDIHTTVGSNPIHGSDVDPRAAQHIYPGCLLCFMFCKATKNIALSLREGLLAPCFLHSLFLIFLLFSSANLFKLLSPFLLSPSLISKPQSLYAAGAQLCVCDCVCVDIHVCVCVCAGFSGTVQPQRAAHGTQRTRAAKKGGKGERERIGGTLESERLSCTVQSGGGRDFWSRLTLTADVSSLGDEGWGERDSNEELRHHSLLPGLFKGRCSGVSTSGWEGQRRKRREEDDRGGELMGLTGPETAKTLLQCEKARDGSDRRDGTGDTLWDKCFLICFSAFP